ncbi:hypothetical protein [Wolbachia endosymbiont of Folsomia candida]|uniref:hypothetical protein n=1 Tax=Wolbachia endosymbiont of Folsomia candida TaxID=169402 RepID=UPI000AF81E7C|nr:hypothetical protein [Wolbachia endosymbiont of Folsomia candida]APR99054.1 hypothetical protein ASM33_07685 [Wolbachia endosymbiont of Folsomia candida]
MCIFWENNEGIRVYAQEVYRGTAIKVSFAWEINSKDIAGCKIEDNNDLLLALEHMPVTRIQVAAFIDFGDMKNDERFSEKDIATLKQFMKDYPDGFQEGCFKEGRDCWKDYGDKDKSEKTITDGLPIMVEVIWEGNLEKNWTEEFRIEVGGKSVDIDVNKLMSIVNEYHQSLDDWACEFPLVDYMSAA